MNMAGRNDSTSAAIQSARVGGLSYVSDAEAGIRRRPHGRGFQYLHADGRPVRDHRVLGRLRSLAIPPAWTDVWICPRADGHLQATGRDARGRKQYLYHPEWRKTRDEMKYDRMIAFARALPTIRSRVKDDLARRGLPRDKVLAAVVRLLETTLVRVGNDEYARENDSFGLTTMRNEHAEVQGNEIHFRFRGKSGIEHDIDLRDPKLASIVRQCQELPGQELFAYLDGAGQTRDVTSSDVNEYIRRVTGEDFTAKDFRTWSGTSLAVLALGDSAHFKSKSDAARKVNRAVDQVARQLGNTRTVCRRDYIHPGVVQAYLDQSLSPALHKALRRLRSARIDDFTAEETAVLELLEELRHHSPQVRKHDRRRASRKSVG